MFLLGPPPFFWSGLPQESVLEQATQQSQQQFSGGLTVQYDSLTIDDETGIATTSGHVKATYGVTELLCDELRINQDTKEFTAIGKVEVFDPDGHLSTQELWGTWNKPPEGATEAELDAFVLGRAKNATGRIGNAKFDAEEVIVHPGLWEMHNVHGTISSKDNPPYGLYAVRVMVRPGKSGVAEKLYLEILGRRIGPIPRYTFTLDRRVTSTGLPSIRQDRERGFGVGWTFNRLLNDNTAITGGYESFPGSAPKYSFEFAYSPLDPGTSGAKLHPRTDMGERAEDGWFDNVERRDPQAEYDDLRQPRLSYSIGTRWNEGASGRLDDASEISKAVDMVYERGGQIGPLGTIFQARLQHIRGEPSEAFTSRALLQGTAIAPDLRISDSLFVHSRADIFFTQSNRGTYSWLRGSAGLIYQPSPELTVGAAYVTSLEAGRPDFRFDPLYSRNAAHFRLDWKSGPYSLKYLYKFDIERGEWYDREWEVSLVADAFEPFVQYRQFPGDYKVGVRFRIDTFIDKITSRDPAKNRKKG